MQACLQGCPSSIKKKLVVHYFLLNEYLAPKFGKSLVIFSKRARQLQMITYKKSKSTFDEESD